MEVIIQVKNGYDRCGNNGCFVTLSFPDTFNKREVSRIVGKVFYSNNKEYSECWAKFWRETSQDNCLQLAEMLSKVFVDAGYQPEIFR
jgi:hypothetical protein